MADILTCTTWDAESSTCTEVALVQEVYLLPESVEAQVSLIINGGFSPEAFTLAFTGSLLIWATGLGIGLIVSQVRKARI
jgi:hypothetical protein